MPNRIPPGQIKKTNRQQIFDYIYREGKVSQQDIAYALRLSRPTVATNLAELEETGLIYKNGQQETDQIGRKAAAYSVKADYRVAVGVEVMRRVVKIIAVDLYGRKIQRVVFNIRYENKDSYFRAVSEKVREFISMQGFREGQVLGVGFAMQGLVSADGTEITYGAILDCTGLTIDVFSQWLDYPCCFIHDPDAAALSELWCSPELTDAVYLSLSRHLGGSTIADRQIKLGRDGRSAAFEHIQVRPKGELCYCGKRGCLETICSMKALLGDEDPEAFFSALRGGGAEEKKRWQTYLKYLGRMIGNLHLICDMDFVLGGHLAPYLMQEDIRFLYDEIDELSPFHDKEDFLLISKMPSHNITIGAALGYIRAFLENIEI